MFYVSHKLNLAQHSLYDITVHELVSSRTVHELVSSRTVHQLVSLRNMKKHVCVLSNSYLLCISFICKL